MQEQRIELRRPRPQRSDLRQILLIACERRQAAETGMRGAVIDRFQPGPQARVEIVQTVDVPFVEFAEKLVAAGPVPALELTLALGCIGPAMDQVNAQPGADPLQGVGAIGGAVVDDQADG
jgi:hypothetical protein